MPLERDLDRGLEELASDYPLLATLTDRRSGGQRMLPVDGPGGGKPEEGDLWGGLELLSAAGGQAPTDGATGKPAGAAAAGRETPGGAGEPDGHEPAGPEFTGTEARVPTRPRKKRRARLTIQIRFESPPGEDRPGRLIDSTVRVNDAHPAYRRSSASRSEGITSR